MSRANPTPEATRVAPIRRRVPESADLVEFFDPRGQVCSWQRENDPAIEAYLSRQHPTGEVQRLETLLQPISQGSTFRRRDQVWRHGWRILSRRGFPRTTNRDPAAEPPSAVVSVFKSTTG